MKFYGIFVFCLLLSLPSKQLDAYELAYTCGDLGPQCLEGESAKQVFWWKRCVSYYVNEQGSSDFDGLSDRALEVVKKSFKEWNDAPPGFRAEFAGLTNVRRSDDFDGNVITWRDDSWPYAAADALALTIISFDPDTGEILDVDIEFNAVVHEFSLAEESTVGTVDFQSTLTHEIGHFVGLDHSQEKEATMYGRSSQGQSKKRTLHEDDIEGFSEIYPSTEEGVCAQVPAYLEGAVDEGCCSTLSARPRNTGLIFLLVLSFLMSTSARNKKDK